MDTKKDSETNSRKKNISKQRFGNKNALGNKGGKGAPLKNKYALTTGEHETILFDDVYDEKELSVFNSELDIYFELEISYKKNQIREYRILKRIKELKEVKGDMVISSITKLKSETTGEFDTETNSTETTVKNVSELILKLEEALTRVQSNMVKIVEKMHKFSLDYEKLEIEKERLEIYRNKQNGIVDIDGVLFDDIDEML